MMVHTTGAGGLLRQVRDGDEHSAQFADLAGQPLLHWSVSQLAALAAPLGRLVHEWAGSWGLAGVDAASVVADSADTLPPADRQWHALHAEGMRARAWIAAPEGGRDAATAAAALVQHALFGVRPAPASQLSHGEEPVADVIGRAAWTDLLALLVQALRLEPAPATVLLPAPPPDAGDRRAWSGAVLVRLPLPLPEQPWHLLLNGACVTQLSAAAPLPPAVPQEQGRRPVPLLQAMQAQTMPLRAELRGPELTLGSLRALAPGDVIMLPHALDQPLVLSGADGEVVCRGYLGQQQGWRALELLANPTPRKPAARGQAD